MAITLDIASEKWRQETLQEGRQEVLRKEIEDLLDVRFGELDSELSRIAFTWIELHKRDRARLLQLPSLSHEKLIAQF